MNDAPGPPAQGPAPESSSESWVARHRPMLSRWGALALIVILVAAGLGYWLSQRGELEEALRLDEFLADAVETATDGRYLVSLGGMTVDVVEGYVVAHDVRLYPNPDNLPPDSVYRLVFTSPRIELAGVQDWQLLMEKGVIVGGRFEVERPAFDIQRPTDNLDYRVESAGVEVGLHDGSARVADMSVFPVGRAAALDSAFQVFVNVPEVKLDGVQDWQTLAEDGIVQADSLRLVRPQVHVRAAVGKAESDVAEDTAEGVPTLHERLTTTLADVALARLYVDSATVSYARGPDEPAPDTLRNVTFRLDGLSPKLHPERPLLSEDFHLAADAYRWTSDDGWYAYTVGPLQLDGAAARLELGEFSLRPTVSHTELQRRLGRRKGQYDLATADLAFGNVDLIRLLEGEGMSAGRLRIGDVRFSYEDDMRWASSGRKSGGPRLPHEVVRRMEAYLRIDTLRIDGGRVAYRRYAEDGSSPGILAFDGIRAVVYNLTNDPARMTGASPAVADVSARLAGSGRLRVQMRYPLLSPSFSLDYTATLSDLSIPALNAMLIPSNGIEVTEGYTETIVFDVGVRGGRATGTVRGRYHDFRIRMVDKEGNRGGILRRLKSVIADNRVRSDNDGDDPRVGVIEHTYEGDASFFRFLWLGLRSGVESITGLDRF